MRVAIVNNQAPFVRGGAELLADWLCAKLIEYGHEAEVVRIPFQWNPPERILDHMLAARLIRIAGVERVVAMKFPAYFVPHENKKLWLLHQFRQVYDLWGTDFQELPADRRGQRIRDSIIAADRRFLPEARHIYTNSRIVGGRLRRYCGIESEPLYPPLFEAERYRCEEYGDYLFMPGRINSLKRQHLAVEAMARTSSDAKLVIAGPPDTAADLRRLHDSIRAHGLERRVEVIDGWISEERKLELLASARGVIYIPLGEDSYGYVTLEAFQARKPVITLRDSDGTLELVSERRNGRVVDGVPGLAGAIDELTEDREQAERWGAAAQEAIAELDISWDRVVRCLTG